MATKKHPLTGKAVLVRDNLAGIHVGTLESVDGRTTVLTDARKVWYWVGAASAHGIAVHGIKNGSKVCPTVARVESFDAVEIVTMTDEAAACVLGFAEWTP